MSFHNEQLPVPGPALVDANSVELIRAWVAQKGLHCSLRPGFWEEKEKVCEEWAWGILLADVAKNLADALNPRHGKDKRATMARIRESFLAEVDAPTSGSEGDFVDGPSRN